MTNRAIAAFLLALLAAPPSVYAQVDFSACADALDTLRRRARDASDPAMQADSAKMEFDRKRDKYNNCRQFPQVYDLFRDGCQNQLREARSASEELDSAVSTLESALDDVDRAVREVASSCGGGVSTTNVPGVTENHQQFCQIVRRFRGRLDTERLKTSCQQNMTAAECNACLSAP